MADLQWVLDQINDVALGCEGDNGALFALSAVRVRVQREKEKMELQEQILAQEVNAAISEYIAAKRANGE